MPAYYNISRLPVQKTNRFLGTQVTVRKPYRFAPKFYALVGHVVQSLL